MLQKIDTYFIDLSEIIWGIAISGLAVILMILPGLIFSIFLVDIFNMLMGEKPYIFSGFDIMLRLIIISIISWYLGRGLGKFNKKSK